MKVNNHDRGEKIPNKVYGLKNMPRIKVCWRCFDNIYPYIFFSTIPIRFHIGDFLGGNLPKRWYCSCATPGPQADTLLLS